MNRFFSLIACLCLLYKTVVQADSAISNSIQHSEVKATELLLQNGMRVILKPTRFELNEVHYRLCANGGYAALPHSSFASGKIASDCAWESGFGTLTADNISRLLYEHSIEFSAEIFPFSRCIEAVSDRKEAEIVFKLINLYFTGQHLTKEAFDIVLAEEKSRIQKKMMNRSAPSINKTMAALNTPKYAIYQSITLQDLENAQFNVAQEFFEAAFSNPSDFTFIIIGDFEEEKIIPFLSQWLGTIPKSPKTQKKWDFSPAAFTDSFPKGITSKTIVSPQRTDRLTRLTFPLSITLNEEKMADLELICRLLENHLRQSIQPQQGFCKLKVYLEFPFHPFLECPLLTIQFRCPPKMYSCLANTVLESLKSFQKEGVSTTKITEAFDALKENSNLWRNENEFWITAFSNYSSWSWDLEKVLKRFEKPDDSRINAIQSIIKNNLVTDNYTLFSAHP